MYCINVFVKLSQLLILGIHLKSFSAGLPGAPGVPRLAAGDRAGGGPPEARRALAARERPQRERSGDAAPEAKNSESGRYIFFCEARIRNLKKPNNKREQHHFFHL